VEAASDLDNGEQVMVNFCSIKAEIGAMKDSVAGHGYSESRLVGAKPAEHGLEGLKTFLSELHSGA